MTGVPSIDPRSGATVEIVAEETTTEQVDAICTAALTAAGPLEDLGRDGRAALLDDLAAALEAHRDRIVEVADRETALGTVRLNGELSRTCYQLRLFGEVLRDGGYLEATVDHPGETPMGPRPDLRRMLVPIGPVAVFGASNFPLAFSVPGGDTASAIAAGSPVVLKAHHSHPATSQLCYEILAEAARKAGAPDGTFGIVHGMQAGADLVAHPAIRAVGFTGSVTGGRALLAIIEQRPEPIPFYGELSSLNPVVVTPEAATDRAEKIGAEFAASFTLGAGQFCTKPGLIFVPHGPDGDRLVTAIRETITGLDPMVMLNAGIATAYQRGTAALASATGESGAPGATGATGVAEATAEARTTGENGTANAIRKTGATSLDEPASASSGERAPARATPLLFAASAAALPPEATEECFGPVTIVARWADEAELFAAVDGLPPSLTATVHRGPGETELPAELTRRFRSRTGRLVYDGYPTGVAVSWAQHHGGPWPATNTQHTSVGATAIRRFLRPVTWQNAPADLLPPELRDEYDSVPRRVDGVLRTRL
ncbi:aldehyde dehydrogenase (NADP(+)) [Actinoplanes xinjiangensis]|uniref:NADP-dependent aldehyde dehydrogenase n=1 Tax=Actinoplanes xinjiangensis TaxID=512350 RepID=A0A316FJB7_9ACTN|nr:aldehyde dehydrogenase (NADP(+)) [Actinoplanes xinjiangensis]PWK49021.1 NADP-dependent aldehyde dehydrogenase [Actinoplanes xinjiangensis]GIF38728.1 aldehyde dehydrogenase [Actinoplanes xinjiangensis]